ncbi:peptidylprolyl isomerase [Novosphingobium sp. KCTC 2891]|uniref:peptidylprolyl isomerase n=1 Tax=Novosphingobium sp. KCTC 2891 TaxID=2989730 RepID=UPI002221C1EB|nr:peptidylprolyl isomerase [Novosphingobium sp. KCTC 2891]MCW1381913.1 peptidylprolyl isomerase [Novosphingobium sp. KCTC 2891]
MNRRFVLAAALPLLIALSAAAPRKAAPHPAPPLPEPVLHDTERVAMTTEAGTIVLDLDGKHAPVSTANFLRYVDQKRFDGIVFYRAMHLDWGTPPNGLVQAGVRGDPKRVLKPIAHEPTNVTGVLHKAGTISMARYAPGTATGDFSILLSDMQGLDAQPDSTNPEAQAGYAAFGHVVEGMDTVRRIWDAPISATAGEGALKGQMLEKPVKVLTVRRIALPAAPPSPPASPLAN